LSILSQTNKLIGSDRLFKILKSFQVYLKLIIRYLYHGLELETVAWHIVTLNYFKIIDSKRVNKIHHV